MEVDGEEEIRRPRTPPEPDEGDLFWANEIPPEVLEYHATNARMKAQREEEERIRVQRRVENDLRLDADNLLRRVRYKIGYHVDTWPPRVIGSKLMIRNVPEMSEVDRHFTTAVQVCKFYRRRRFIPEEIENGVVVVVANDEDITAMETLFGIKEFIVVTVRDHDIRMNCQAVIEEKISIFRKKDAHIFLCTLNLEDFGLIPFGKLTFFETVTDNNLFNAFATRQTERSRLRYETSMIEVCITPSDDVQIVDGIIGLMIQRGDYPSEQLLEYCQEHYWKDKPQERQFHESVMEDEAKVVQREKAAVLDKIGPYREAWWEDYDILDKVQRFVGPSKEFQYHHRLPKKMRNGCPRNCSAYQEWVAEDPEFRTPPPQPRRSSRRRPRPVDEEEPVPEEPTGIRPEVPEWQLTCFPTPVEVHEDVCLV